MAFAEKRGEWYRIVFPYWGKKYRQTLDAGDERLAIPEKISVAATTGRDCYAIQRCSG